MINIIKRIFNNLATPHLIPLKIMNKIKFYYNLKRYNKNLFENEQNTIFRELGLDRSLGLEKYNLIKKKLDFSLNRNMSSEHEVLFSSLSLVKHFKNIDILEIGTFDGINALLLSKLFLNSKIDTIDLPHGDKDFKNFYNRKNSIHNFIDKRNNVLDKNENINFFEMNSLKLLNYKKKYDLIWIDGAHGYPVVCIDIINSLNLIKEKGLILCDDVHLNLNHLNSDSMYNSIASYETLNELQKQSLINFKLIYKRLSPKENCVKKQRKFVAVLSKNFSDREISF